MRYTAQLRAARSLLGLRQEEVAKAAKVGLATLQRIEQREGMVQANFSTVVKIQAALEKAGVVFIDENDEGGIGVRLKKPHQASS